MDLVGYVVGGGGAVPILIYFFNFSIILFNFWNLQQFQSSLEDGVLSLRSLFIFLFQFFFRIIYCLAWFRYL